MKIILWIVAILVGLLVLFFAWRIWIGLAYQKRIRRAIDDVMGDGSKPIDRDLVNRTAENPMLRNQLLDALTQRDLAALFPAKYLNRESLAEASLVHWLCHPAELGRAPDEIELAEVVPVTVGNKTVEYFLFRFRTNEPHWSADNGWMAGAAGPFRPGHVTPVSASGLGGTFSELAKFDSKSPLDHLKPNLNAAEVTGANDRLGIS